ncbi:transposase [Brevibacterium casei]|uniref:transposase n=1 Tax=Brevibacterium TaxID=1696 RepID=UPI00223B6731|nr:transposase [Brevibacterium casei]MCT1448962.1 transposase [Brevibacterium casei]
MKAAGPDPFAGYTTAIEDKLDDAVAVLDAFHVVKHGTATVDEVRRRVQNRTPSGTADARATRPTGYRPFSAPGLRTSRRSSRPGFTRQWKPTSPTTKCSSHDSAHSNSDPSTTTRTWQRDD